MRAWRLENGKKCVAIVCGGGAMGEAVLTIRDSGKMKSLCSKTVSLGVGRFRFKSDDLGADVLLFE